jgi:cathepsin L
MAKFPIGVCICLSMVAASRVKMTSFDSYMQLHGRAYSKGSAEYDMRRALYEDRLMRVAAHNNQTDKMWTAGVNKLSDWTEGELQTLRGWDGSAKPSRSGRSIYPHSKAFLQQATELPTEKIWVDLKAGRVRNQADCGSCWAIAAATVLEAHAEISGRPRTFSAQQIVECTPNPRKCGGDGGCQGATAELAMDWVVKNGCAEESAIPYSGQDAACASTSPQLAMAQVFGAAPAGSGGAAFGMTGWETLPKNEYEPLARAVAERGPVAVSVAADAWSMYESGIFNGCGKDAVIDHAVTSMGYGEENGVKYWLIQNSWGADWGEAGRIRLQRHDVDEYCGMNNKPELGVACKGETDPVPVCGMCGVLFDSVVPHFQTA